MKVNIEEVIYEYSVRNKLDEDIPVYSVTNNKGFCTGYFSKDVASKDKSTYKIVPQGYFAYNPSRINVGSVDWQRYKEKVIVSPLYVVFGVLEKINQQYLFHYLKSDIILTYIKEYATGSVRDNLKLSELGKFPINLPPLDEQHRVAAVLDKVSDLIALRKKQLAKLDELVKARFVEMFGNEKDFYSTQLYNSVEEMFIGPFGSSLKNDCFVPKKQGFCMVYEQKHAIRKTLDVETRYVNEKKFQELKRFSVYGGDIIVSCRGTIGETYIVPECAPLGIMHPSIMKIRLKMNVYDKAFFNQLLQNFLKKYNDKVNGSGVKMAITAKMLGEQEFILPPLELQKQFANFVEVVEKQKKIIQRSLEKLEILKKSLMQEYFG